MRRWPYVDTFSPDIHSTFLQFISSTPPADLCCVSPSVATCSPASVKFNWGFPSPCCTAKNCSFETKLGGAASWVQRTVKILATWDRRAAQQQRPSPVTSSAMWSQTVRPSLLSFIVKCCSASSAAANLYVSPL